MTQDELAKAPTALLQIELHRRHMLDFVRGAGVPLTEAEVRNLWGKNRHARRAYVATKRRAVRRGERRAAK